MESRQGLDAGHRTTDPIIDPASHLADAVAAVADQHYDATAHDLDYGKAGVSREYVALQCASSGLAAFDPARLTSAEARLAFWLNAYNALLLVAVRQLRVTGSIRDVEGFFSASTCTIGGEDFSLDEIEHGILRANARRYLGIKPLLGRDDPRLAWAFARVEPLLHFGLYTASVSSPPLQAFRPEQVHDQLRQGALATLDRSVVVDPDDATVVVPRTFHWYRIDFGGQPGILDFVAGHLPEDSRAESIRRDRDRLRIATAEYDWTLNDRYAASG